MATQINKGSKYEIRNITANSSTDTPIDFTNRMVNAVIIKCRTAVDLQLRLTPNGNDYFTIPSGTTFHFDVAVSDNSQGGYIVGYIRSASSTPVVEVIGIY